LWTVGQLPSPGTRAIGATLFPQVFGDPDVKYLGKLRVRVLLDRDREGRRRGGLANDGSASLHRLRKNLDRTFRGDFGHQPQRIVEDGVPADAADKEFMDGIPRPGACC